MINTVKITRSLSGALTNTSLCDNYSAFTGFIRKHLRATSASILAEPVGRDWPSDLGVPIVANSGHSAVSDIALEQTLRLGRIHSIIGTGA